MTLPLLVLLQRTVAWYQCGYEHHTNDRSSLSTRNDDERQKKVRVRVLLDSGARGTEACQTYNTRPTTHRCTVNVRAHRQEPHKVVVVAACLLRGPAARARARERVPRPSIK